MGTDDRDIISEVEAVLDEFVRPYLATHGGDLKVVGVEAGYKEGCSGKRHQPGDARADLGAPARSSQFLTGSVRL